MKRLLTIGFCFALAIAVFGQLPTSLAPSYLPAVGKTLNYRLLLNGEVQVEMAGVVGFAHFAATVEIEQKWQKSGDNLRCDLTVKGGTLRVFSSVGEQTQKIGWTQITFITTTTGEVIDLIGGGARSFDELVANFDLMATALATLVVPFPKGGVKVGDGWQGAHQLGPTITLTTIQLVEQPNTLPIHLQPIKIRLRYLLPIDALIDPLFRAQTNFTARYSAESEVIFSVTEGRTVSATGTIKLEVGGKVPTPTTPNQETSPKQKQQPEGSSSERENEQGQNQPQEQAPTTTPPPTVAPTFQLKVDAKFDLVQAH